MPCGLSCAAATFQRMLDSIIGPDMEDYAFAYLDDIIVVSATFEDHLKHLREVFIRLQKSNLRINREKCVFCKSKLKYLGYMVSDQGISTDPDKIAAVQDLNAPRNVKELRRIMGLTSWYRRFIKDFSTVATPLTMLLKKNQEWSWGDAQETAFLEIKKRLTEAPVLMCPDFDFPLILQTDASDYGLGVVLSQISGKQERVIAYASRTLTDLEKKYAVTEKECLAILFGIRKMRPYLEGYHFTVVTDHHSLKWLHSIDNPSGRLSRWAIELQQYDFEIKYRKGAMNVVESDLSTVVDISGDWVQKRSSQVLRNPEKYPEYRIMEGRLYRKFTAHPFSSQDTAWKLCLPTADRAQVLHDNHDVPTAGHLGVVKTAARVMNSYYWPGMYRDISRYVSSFVIR